MEQDLVNRISEGKATIEELREFGITDPEGYMALFNGKGQKLEEEDLNNAV